MTTLSGRCLCGAVRFELQRALSAPHACHCTECRRQSGHYVVASEVQRAGFALTEDRGLKWYRSSDSARRGFCGDCGSVLFWDDGGATVSINLGCLEGPTGLTLQRHIFVDEKGDYYALDDSLPKFAGYDRPLEAEGTAKSDTTKSPACLR